MLFGTLLLMAKIPCILTLVEVLDVQRTTANKPAVYFKISL